jgi:hypothetical protein
MVRDFSMLEYFDLTGFIRQQLLNVHARGRPEVSGRVHRCGISFGMTKHSLADRDVRRFVRGSERSG